MVTEYDGLFEKSAALARKTSLDGESDNEDEHTSHNLEIPNEVLENRQRENVRRNALKILDTSDDKVPFEPVWTLDFTPTVLKIYDVAIFLMLSFWALVVYALRRSIGDIDSPVYTFFSHLITEIPSVFRLLSFVFVDSTTLRGHLFANAPYVIHHLLMTASGISCTTVLCVYGTSVISYHFFSHLITFAKRKKGRADCVLYAQLSNGVVTYINWYCVFLMMAHFSVHMFTAVNTCRLLLLFCGGGIAPLIDLII